MACPREVGVTELNRICIKKVNKVVCDRWSLEGILTKDLQIHYFGVSEINTGSKQNVKMDGIVDCFLQYSLFELLPKNA